MKCFLAVIGLVVSIFISVHFIHKKTVIYRGFKDGVTFSLSPIYLGNTAVATLATRLPVTLPVANFNDRSPEYSVTLRAQYGDTITSLLDQMGVFPEQISNVINALEPIYNPSKIREGQKIDFLFKVDPDVFLKHKSFSYGEFLGLSLMPDFSNVVNVRKNSDNIFIADIKKRHLFKKSVRASNIIQQSLFLSGREVDVPDEVLANLIRLYSWDIDFQRDIRKGDSFQLLFEQHLDDEGEVAYNGDLIFAALHLRGKKHSIYRHFESNGEVGYYNEKGHSAKKALMRTPIDGARLSSGFGKRRHPILGYTKMHRGIDFAAPVGTPIYAAGNGKITYAGRNGAYGKFVVIRHSALFSTAYAHMKRIRTLKGSEVKQGQVIGYVGTSGRSTGPHLHYEIRKNGRRVNPLIIKLPSGQKLNGRELEAFLKNRDEINLQYIKGIHNIRKTRR